MQDPTKTNPPAANAAQAKELTAAAAAKSVRRPVSRIVDAGTDGDGKKLTKVVTKLVAVRADEVLSFKDYGSHIVVVTNDGQKFSSADATVDAAAE